MRQRPDRSNTEAHPAFVQNHERTVAALRLLPLSKKIRDGPANRLEGAFDGDPRTVCRDMARSRGRSILEA
jgi:hypothetical protein